MRRLFVLLFTPWIALCLYGSSRASAATYPDNGAAPTAQVLSARVVQERHGVNAPSSALPFTGTDALMLATFGAAVLLPGIGLLVVARRHRGEGIAQGASA